MTDPLAYTPARWSRDGCNVCGRPSSTVSGIDGKRCDRHPGEFDPSTAVELHVGGFPGAALAYVRWPR